MTWPQNSTVYFAPDLWGWDAGELLSIILKHGIFVHPQKAKQDNAEEKAQWRWRSLLSIGLAPGFEMGYCLHFQPFLLTDSALYYCLMGVMAFSFLFLSCFLTFQYLETLPGTLSLSHPNIFIFVGCSGFWLNIPSERPSWILYFPTTILLFFIKVYCVIFYHVFTLWKCPPISIYWALCPFSACSIGMNARWGHSFRLLQSCILSYTKVPGMISSISWYRVI